MRQSLFSRSRGPSSAWCWQLRRPRKRETLRRKRRRKPSISTLRPLRYSSWVKWDIPLPKSLLPSSSTCRNRYPTTIPPRPVGAGWGTSRWGMDGDADSMQRIREIVKKRRRSSLAEKEGAKIKEEKARSCSNRRDPRALACLITNRLVTRVARKGMRRESKDKETRMRIVRLPAVRRLASQRLASKCPTTCLSTLMVGGAIPIRSTLSWGSHTRYGGR